MPQRESYSSSSLPRTPGRAANPQRDGRGTTGSPLFTHRFRWGAFFFVKKGKVPGTQGILYPSPQGVSSLRSRKTPWGLA